MSQSESGGGAIIVVVIVLGAAWVAFGMFHQGGGDSSPMPKVPTMSPQARAYLSARENPYVAALLGPQGASSKIRESERFSQLLKKRMAGARPAIEKNIPGGDNDHAGRLLSDIDAAYDRGDTEHGLAAVKEALSYASVHPDVSKRARIDIALAGGRLSYRARDFDQSRQYVYQAIALAHHNQDYKMDDLEGLRCLLSGNGNEAASYNIALSQFNESLSQSDYKRLPELADGLVRATGPLPEDSFFSLHAQLSKATAVLLATNNTGEAKLCLKKVEALAEKAQDEEIVQNCQGLMAKIDGQ